PLLPRVQRATRTTLFPYTTLFRSSTGGDVRRAPRVGDAPVPAGPDAARRGARGRGRAGRGGGAAALPGAVADRQRPHAPRRRELDRKSTRLNSSHDQISYAVFCLR